MNAFFPFGAANGDVVAPRVVDESFGPTRLDVPLVLFNNSVTSIYVSVHAQLHSSSHEQLTV